MRTNSKIAFMIIFAIFISACEKDDQTQEPEVKLELELANLEKSGGIIGAEFPQAKQQVMETFGEIAQSIIDHDMDKLISFHAYGPKFTEFKNGQLRNGGAENEQYERDVFGSVFEVIKFGANDLKIAVYGGNVANLTFHSDFVLVFEEGEPPVTIINQITLLFVRTNNGWKMVHEHHSPLTA